MLDGITNKPLSKKNRDAQDQNTLSIPGNNRDTIKYSLKIMGSLDNEQLLDNRNLCITTIPCIITFPLYPVRKF